MSDRVQVAGLQVAKALFDFVETEALPGTGLDSDAFWAGAASVITDLAPKNKTLLAVRDEIQGKVDAWHGEHAGPEYDRTAYKTLLKEIGYLLDEPADFQITTSGVDTEITTTAGPQLVVPVLNARFAINTSNARWGSLYDALYGTDAISEADGAEKGTSYNKVRGDKVIAFARDFLDEAAPLSSGSHVGTTKYVVDAASLTATLDSGETVGLEVPSQLLGYQGSLRASARDREVQACDGRRHPRDPTRAVDGLDRRREAQRARQQLAVRPRLCREVDRPRCRLFQGAGRQ